MNSALIEGYKNTFIGDYASCKKYDPSSHGWYPHADRFDFGHVDEHLQEDRILGRDFCFPDQRCGVVVLDFDYHSRNYSGREEFERRVVGITDSFRGKSKFLLTSSESGNYHTYLFFKNHYLPVVEQRVRGHLTGLGWGVEPGLLEVFGVDTKILRCPFGPGSKLITGVNVVDHHDKEFQIRHILNKLSTAQLPTIYEATPEYIHVREAPLSSTPNEVYETHRLLKEGLGSIGTFHTSCVKVAKHFWKQTGFNRALTGQLSGEWLESHHNGKSRTYNLNPTKAHDELAHVVEWLEVSPYDHRRGGLDMIVMGGVECDFITTYFSKYSEQKSIFQLFKFVKSTIRKNKNKLIPLSQKLQTNTAFKIGMNKENYLYLKTRLEELELISRIFKGSTSSNVCSLYKWVGPNFTSGDAYGDLAQYIVANNLLGNYSRHIQNKIKEEYEQASSLYSQ